MSCAWPTSSCTFAVRASFRWSVGARRIQSRSGRTPISSELPCIAMNFASSARYSSGIGSPASTTPPDWTCSRNAASVVTNRIVVPDYDAGHPDVEVEGLDDAGLLTLHRSMVLLRTYDERSLTYHRQGRIGTYAIFWG